MPLPQKPLIVAGSSNLISPKARRPEEASASHSTLTLTSTSGKHGLVIDGSPRPPKKMKAGGDGKPDSPPSLLSRMGSSAAVARSRPNKATPHIAQRFSAAEDDAPLGGYSIKGAAKTASNDVRPVTQRQSTTSLLERLKSGGAPSEDGRRKKRERG